MKKIEENELNLGTFKYITLKSITFSGKAGNVAGTFCSAGDRLMATKVKLSFIPAITSVRIVGMGKVVLVPWSAVSQAEVE